MQDDMARANELVLAAHGNLATVQDLVRTRPELINQPGVGPAFGGETPLAAASHTHNRAIAETLLANGAEHDIYTAVFMEDRPRVEAFLCAKPELVTTPGIHDIPILSFATTPEMAEFLIASGAEVNAMSRAPFQTTPLHGAARRGYVGVADVFLQHGADATVADYNGKTPVELVSTPEVSAVFRAHGIPVE
jgi:ankyrin repeat protein